MFEVQERIGAQVDGRAAKREPTRSDVRVRAAIEHAAGARQRDIGDFECVVAGIAIELVDAVIANKPVRAAAAMQNIVCVDVSDRLRRHGPSR